MSSEDIRTREPWEFFYLDTKLKEIAKKIEDEYWEDKVVNRDHVDRALNELINQIPENKLTAYRETIIGFKDDIEELKKYLRNKLEGYERDIFIEHEDYFVERFFKYLKYYYFTTLMKNPELFENEERYIHIHP